MTKLNRVRSRQAQNLPFAEFQFVFRHRLCESKFQSESTDQDPQHKRDFGDKKRDASPTHIARGWYPGIRPRAHGGIFVNISRAQLDYLPTVLPYKPTGHRNPPHYWQLVSFGIRRKLASLLRHDTCWLGSPLLQSVHS